MKTSNLKKYLKFLQNSKQKNVSLLLLSRGVNIKEDIILDELSYFNPILRMISDDFNFKTLIDDIEKYLKKIESENQTKKKKVSKRVKVDKDLDILSYIYSLMILDNGFVDRSYKFSDQDLKKLRLLVNKEIKKRKENKWVLKNVL